MQRLKFRNPEFKSSLDVKICPKHFKFRVSISLYEKVDVYFSILTSKGMFYFLELKAFCVKT